MGGTQMLVRKVGAGCLPPPAVGEGWEGGATLTTPRRDVRTVPPTLSLPHAGGGKRLGRLSGPQAGGGA